MGTLESRSELAIRRFREHGVRFLESPPEGWHRIEGATTAPNGWEWWGHGSLFWRTNGREPYQHALVRRGAAS
jgi:hypothetical protein